jgi:hypothetical protein
VAGSTSEFAAATPTPISGGGSGDRSTMERKVKADATGDDNLN